MQRVRIDTSKLVARHHHQGSWRRSKYLPLLLFALVVSTLVLITLSHIAVIHRVSFAQQMLSYPGSNDDVRMAKFNHSSNRKGLHHRGHGVTARTGSSKMQQNQFRSVKLEPLLSRNVIPIEVNAILLGQFINEKKILHILEKAGEMRKSLQTHVERVNLSAMPYNESWTNWTVSTLQLEMETPLLPYCPQVPPRLDGPLFPENHPHDDFRMEQLVALNADVRDGGRWKPEGCTSRHRVAVIIPYRDRQEHLTTLLSHLHPILKKQQLDYTIYVAEQRGNGTFNKGILMNAAFMMSMKEANYHCFVFHDVDLIPEDDRNMYSCPQYPRHMSVAVDEFQYKLPYTFLVGGVFSIQANHFLRVNGYSNMYWGWGGEDDDMSARIVHSGLSIVRPSSAIARYRMIKHVKRKPLVWKIRGKLLGTAKRRMRFDGLNTLNYTLIASSVCRLYTNFTIDVGTNPFPSDIT